MLDLSKQASRPHVIVGTPTPGGGNQMGYFVSILGLLQATDPERVLPQFVPSTGSNIAENQNALVDVMDERGATHLLLVENDMAFPGDALMRLLSHDKDIVGATYPYKDHDLLARVFAGEEGAMLRYMGKEIDGTDITYESLAQGERLKAVEFLPMGLMLLSMKAVNAVRERVRESVGIPQDIKSIAFYHSVAFDVTRPEKRAITTTTDSVFCRNAREAGMDIWCDAPLSLAMEHIGTANFGLLPVNRAPL